jgi:hypothetical protein
MDRTSLKRAVKRGPIYLAKRLAYKLYERRHPDEPWISQGAVKFLDAELPRNGVGLEWGSGRSTQWFSKRLAKLTSIEDQCGWYEIVKGQVDGNVDLRLIEIADPSGKTKGQPYTAVAEELPDRSLDFVLIDGPLREDCVRAAIPKMKPGALFVIDNTDWPTKWGVPPEWPIAHCSRNVMSETTIWRVS